MKYRDESMNPLTQNWEAETSPLDRIKKTAADKLHLAARALHDKSESGTNRDLGQYGHRAADWLDQTADYVNEINPQQIKDDLKNQIQRHPGRTLLIAGGVGLLLGSMFRRR